MAYVYPVIILWIIFTFIGFIKNNSQNKTKIISINMLVFIFFLVIIFILFSLDYLYF